MGSLATRRLGYLLRWLRQREGLSQEAMGRRLGCSQAQVDKLENYRTDKAGVVWLEKACQSFGVPWGYFAAPGPAELDPAQYIRDHAVETQLEALARSVARLDDEMTVVRAVPKEDEPPSSSRKRSSGRR